MFDPLGILLSSLAAPLSHSPVRCPRGELRPRASKFPNNWLVLSLRLPIWENPAHTEPE